MNMNMCMITRKGLHTRKRSYTYTIDHYTYIYIIIVVIKNYYYYSLFLLLSLLLLLLLLLYNAYSTCVRFKIIYTGDFGPEILTLAYIMIMFIYNNNITQ